MKKRITFMLAAAIALFAGWNIGSAQINAFPQYREDFESGANGWSVGGTRPSWELGYPSKQWIYGTTSGENCWVTGLYSPYNTGEYSYLTSPQLDFSCYTQDPTIEFNLSYYTEAYPDWQEGYDFCWVEYSTNGGSTWSTLGSEGTGMNWMQTYWDDGSGGTKLAWGGDDAYGYGFGWLTAQNTISGAAGKNNVRIRFVMYADPWGYELDGMAIDDISIYAQNPTLAAPVLATPANGAINQPLLPTLTWGNVGCATGYDIQIANNSSFTSPVVNITNNTTLSYTSSVQLAAATMYYWRVRARSTSIIGNWSAANTFTTQFPPPPTPILLAPDNNSAALALTTSLLWAPSTGAMGYRLQVSTDPTFSTTIVDQQLTGTTYTFTASDNFIKYYWRVNASNPQGISPWSTVWNFRTIIGTPALIQPLTAVKGVATPLTLTWSSVNGAAFYDIQASKDALFTTIEYSNTSISTSDILQTLKGNTQYFWRVRANADATERGNWSVIWTFSTIVGTPFLTKPFDASLDLQPQSITLSWNAVEGFANYHVQIATDILFTNLAKDTSKVVSTSLLITGLQANTLYYWRVQAENPINGKSSWSDYNTFSTIVGKVVGISPVNDKKGVTLPASVVWSSAGQGKTYQIQVATDANFTKIVTADEKIGETSGAYGFNAGLQNYTRYYWRVRPIAQTNAQVPWSDIMSFTSNIGAPVLVSPANASANQPLAVTLKWKATAGAAKYIVRVFEDDAAQALVFEDDAVAGTTVSPSGIKAEMKYIWTVQAVDADNFTSAWSETWKFATTTVFAAIPTLEKPVNNSTDVAVNPTLEWKAADYAQSYDVQVASYSNFSSTIVNLTGVTDVSLPIQGLSNGERYFWRVRAVNAAGPSAWSDIWTFVASPLSPSMVALLSPPNGAGKQPLSVVLQWNNLPEAISYQAQASEDQTFATTTSDKSDLQVNSNALTNLKPKTTYYWRVRATNAIGDGPWSETWAFTTDEVSGITDRPATSLMSQLEAIYPNPTAHSANIKFTLYQPATIALIVFNNLGNIVATIAEGNYGEGQHAFNWNFENLPSGSYSVRLTVGRSSTTQTLNIVR